MFRNTLLLIFSIAVAAEISQRDPEWLTASGNGFSLRAAVARASERDTLRASRPTEPPCLADTNHDGRLDAFDFLAMSSALAAEEPVADLAPPYGVYDALDFLAFQRLFGVGCP